MHEEKPRLVIRLRTAVSSMAPHQKEREQGKLLIESLAEIERLEKRFTKLGNPKYSGEFATDSSLVASNLEFEQWVESLPSTYWVRYDISAARVGWEAACKFLSEKQTKA